MVVIIKYESTFFNQLESFSPISVKLVTSIPSSCIHLGVHVKRNCTSIVAPVGLEGAGLFFAGWLRTPTLLLLIYSKKIKLMPELVFEFYKRQLDEIPCKGNNDFIKIRTHALNLHIFIKNSVLKNIFKNINQMRYSV